MSVRELADRRARRRLVAAAAAASALLIGCSSAATDGVPSAAKQSGAGKSSGTTLTRARMRSALLKRSDLSAGWQSNRQDSNNGDMPIALQRRLAKCLGEPHAVTRPLSQVGSPSFARGHVQISSSVERYRRRQVARDVTSIRNPKAPRCFGEVFRTFLPTVLPSNADLTNVVVHIAKHAHGAPKDVVGLMTVSFDILVSGRQVASNVTETMIAKRNVEADVDTVVIGGRVDRSMQHRLGNVVARRVARL